MKELLPLTVLYNNVTSSSLSCLKLFIKSLSSKFKYVTKIMLQISIVETNM